MPRFDFVFALLLLGSACSLVLRQMPKPAVSSSLGHLSTRAAAGGQQHANENKLKLLVFLPLLISVRVSALDLDLEAAIGTSFGSFPPSVSSSSSTSKATSTLSTTTAATSKGEQEQQDATSSLDIDQYLAAPKGEDIAPMTHGVNK